MKNEKWKQIDNYPYYEVSNKGRIRSWINSKQNKRKEPYLLNPFKVNGYLKVHLYKNGDKNRLLVSRLVAKAFIGNSKDKNEINHKDGNKLNNNIDNLEWVTRSENLQHAYDTGLRKKPNGESNGKSKLTESDVLDIRNAYKLNCFSYQDLADAYDVGKTCIAKIIKRKNWAHL